MTYRRGQVIVLTIELNVNPVQKYRLASTNFADIQYYQNGYISTDTDTDIHIGAPLVKDEC